MTGDRSVAFAALTAADTVLAAVTRSSGNPPEYPVSLGDLRSVIVDPLKVIVSTSGRVELYDLRADPDESRNLAALAEWADERAALERVLERRPLSRDRSEN